MLIGVIWESSVVKRGGHAGEIDLTGFLFAGLLSGTNMFMCMETYPYRAQGASDHTVGFFGEVGIHIGGPCWQILEFSGARRHQQLPFESGPEAGSFLSRCHPSYTGGGPSAVPQEHTGKATLWESCLCWVLKALYTVLDK